MKKITVLLIAAATIASFSACGKDESLPEGMSQELYDTAVKALEIMDKYNDADINAEEADDRLDALYNKIENMDLNDQPDDGKIWSESERALFIQTDINSFRVALNPNTSSDTYTAADKLREELELD